ncbi:RnfABCDGE type electron transport complex subunit D [Candidatus Curtissbacteria bacterium]|nr:RnfABCDGE type electron transport complex subunit D [Candidatus Curtissbacteria bacterium]
MDIKFIFNDFKSQVAFTLLLVWLLAQRPAQDKLLAFALPLFAVLLMTALDVVYTRIRFKKWYWPSASVVTGFLIGLVIDPKEPVGILALAVLAAFISKQFIGSGFRQHIFNPAAFGIMTVTFAFGVPVAWWGVAWGKLPLVILVVAMMRILWRMKRLWLPLGFLAVYSIYYLTLFEPKNAALALADGSLLLFALVMLPEPMTSPIIGKSKYIFGPVVALLAIGLSYWGVMAEVFLPALLAANLGAYLARRLNNGSARTAVVGKDGK